MNKTLLFLLLAFSLCFGQAVKKTEIIYDTVIVKQTVIDTVHKFNPDSLTVAMLKDSQNFYSTSFYLILAVISILLIILLGIWAYLNFKYIKDFENKLNEEFKKTNDKISIIEENTKEQIKQQIEKSESKINEQRKEFKGFKSQIIREFAYNNLNVATSSRETNKIDYFVALNNFCRVYQDKEIDFQDLDLLIFNYFNDLIKLYDKEAELPDYISKLTPSLIEILLQSFSQIKAKYENVDIIKEIWKNLQDKFGEPK